MSSLPFVHFDNAATSFPKPEAVWDAVDAWQRRNGAPVGRGSYAGAVETQRAVDRCRLLAARLLGAEGPDRVSFAFNGTDALNLALHGLLRSGDHVVTGTIEHNSVLRPLRELERRRGVSVTRLAPGPDGRLDPRAVAQALRPETRLVAVMHASNVSGAIQPVAEIAETARRHGALVLVDAAQTAGHLPIDVRNLGADLLACSGHKGLLGLLGTGLLYVRPGIEDRLDPLRQGGTGTSSESDDQPGTLPEKYESGNHVAPGLIGLAEGLAWLAERGIDAVRRHEIEVTERFLAGARRIAGLVLHGPARAEDRTGVVSATAAGFAPHELAAVLDEGFGIRTRAGLHCAPGAHRALGTFEGGGTVRFSAGPFTTPDDVDRALAALGEILG